MEAHAAGIGEHIQYVILGLGEVPHIRMEGVMLLPVLLPFLFDFAVIIDAHGFLGPLLNPVGGDDLAKIDLFGIGPKPLQIVELPGFLGEYMNDQAAVVQ